MPDRFKRDFSKLSGPTKSEVLNQHEHSPLQIISVNPTKDYVIAKFENNSGRWSNEHIGLSTLNGRAIETRVEQEGRFSDRWQVQFTIDQSLTRPTMRRWNQPPPPQESVSSTRLLQKRITSMMLDHVQHLPPEAVLVASAVESDGGGRGRTAIYRRYGFKPDPDSAMGELETEVSIGEFIKRATGRTDAVEAGRRQHLCGTPLA